MTLSVCIATHERPNFVLPTLNALMQQKREPDEIVISDSSSGADTYNIVKDFRFHYGMSRIKYVHSKCRSLPYQRLWAFQHTSSDIVLFLDDDIELNANALYCLMNAYDELLKRGEQVAGIGLNIIIKNYNYAEKGSTLRWKWLGISEDNLSFISEGGISRIRRFPPGANPALIEVGRLSGGAMSYLKEVLKRIGSLENLVYIDLKYQVTGEDAIFSKLALGHGKLYLLVGDYGFHPPLVGTNQSYLIDGWKRGIADTWARSHIMRWLAVDLKSYRREWRRVALLEIARTIYWGILRRPFMLSNWTRLAGSIWGTIKGLFLWRHIPPEP